MGGWSSASNPHSELLPPAHLQPGGVSRPRLHHRDKRASLASPKNPDRWQSRRSWDPNALAPPPQELPTGLPSQLLERRPDIEQAEATLIAANAQIGVARAQFFPNLSISASGGVGGDSLSIIFDPAGKTIYRIGTLAQPLFEGGKLRGQLQLSQEIK
jgi:Outer membrane efflux protein